MRIRRQAGRRRSRRRLSQDAGSAAAAVKAAERGSYPAVVGDQPDDQDLKFAIGSAESLLIMIGCGSLDIEGCRNLASGRGIDPAAVRDVVRHSAGALMTPPPRRLSDVPVEFVEWSHEDGGVVRTPVWTEAGISSLQLLITVQPERYDGSAQRFWNSFISGVVDELGHSVLTPADAPSPASPPYPEWTEERPGRAIDETRIPRGAFTGASYGIRFGQLIDGMQRVHRDVLAGLDHLNEGQAAIVLLRAFFDGLYGDGIIAAYQRLAVDGAPRRLAAAAELVGADAYAVVFARIAEALPLDVSESWTVLRSHLEAIEAAEGDAGDEDTLLGAYENRIYQLEDEGDVVWQHMADYVEHHPDQFFTNG